MGQARQPQGRRDGGQFRKTGAHTGANGLPPQFSDEEAEARGEYAMESDDDWVDTPEGRHEATDTMLANSVLDSGIDRGRMWASPEEPEEWRTDYGWGKDDVSPDGLKPDTSHTYPDEKSFQNGYIKPILRRNGGIRRYDMQRLTMWLQADDGTYAPKRMYGEAPSRENLTRLALLACDRKASGGERDRAEKSLTRLTETEREKAFHALPEERQDRLLEKEGRLVATEPMRYEGRTAVPTRSTLGYVMDRYPELFTHKGWRKTTDGISMWVAPKDGREHDPVKDICRWSGQSREKVLRTLGKVDCNRRGYPTGSQL